MSLAPRHEDDILATVDLVAQHLCPELLAQGGHRGGAARDHADLVW
jgi:hypothetical protein